MYVKKSNILNIISKLKFSIANSHITMVFSFSDETDTMFYFSMVFQRSLGPILLAAVGKIAFINSRNLPSFPSHLLLLAWTFHILSFQYIKFLLQLFNSLQQINRHHFRIPTKFHHLGRMNSLLYVPLIYGILVKFILGTFFPRAVVQRMG